MIVKGIIDEDFVNYKKPSMIIEMPYCSFKCDKESGQQVCQNATLATAPDIEISIIHLINRYLKNPITQAVVFQGLEPFDSLDYLISFIRLFRELSDDDIVIYTGYTEEELADSKFPINNKRYNRISFLSQFKNIIIKFVRFIPNQLSHFDEVLGVHLASPNQYAKCISRKE